jgi:hypothetical protein
MGVKQPFNRGRLSTPVLVTVPGSGSFPRSEPHDCVRGVGASTCGAKFEEFAFSRLTEVALTAVPAGTPTGATAPAGRIVVGSQTAAVFALHSNSVPSVQMQRRMTAILRATATFAFLAPTHFINRVPHTFRADQRWVRCSNTLAASNR